MYFLAALMLVCVGVMDNVDVICIRYDMIYTSETHIVERLEVFSLVNIFSMTT